MADRAQLIVGNLVRLRVHEDYPDDPQEVGHVMSVDQNTWGMSYTIRVLPEHAMDADDDLYREVMDEDVAEILGFD